MNISKKILRAINEGILNALSFDDELPDTLEITMHRISNDNAAADTAKLEKEYYSLKLQEIAEANGDDTEEFAKLALELYKKYGATYNPHVDGVNFRNFIHYCVVYLGNNADLNWIDTSEVTDMSYLFRFSDFNGDISKWDVSNVTDMSYMFSKSYKFNNDISEWDVSNVKNMSWMFFMAVFNKPIGNWEVSNVTTMLGMFREDENFNLDLSTWDISNVTSVAGMFCYTPICLDLSNWDVEGKYTNNMFDTDTKMKVEYFPKHYLEY